MGGSKNKFNEKWLNKKPKPEAVLSNAAEIKTRLSELKKITPQYGIDGMVYLVRILTSLDIHKKAIDSLANDDFDMNNIDFGGIAGVFWRSLEKKVSVFDLDLSQSITIFDGSSPLVDKNAVSDNPCIIPNSERWKEYFSRLIAEIKKQKNEYCVLRAYSEADFELVKLYKERKISFICSEDSDLLVLGCNQLFKLQQKQFIQTAGLLEENGATQDQLIVAYVLAGSDYNKGISFARFGTSIHFVLKSHPITTKEKLDDVINGFFEANKVSAAQMGLTCEDYRKGVHEALRCFLLSPCFSIDDRKVIGLGSVYVETDDSVLFQIVKSVNDNITQDRRFDTNPNPEDDVVTELFMEQYIGCKYYFGEFPRKLDGNSIGEKTALLEFDAELINQFKEQVHKVWDDTFTDGHIDVDLPKVNYLHDTQKAFIKKCVEEFDRDPSRMRFEPPSPLAKNERRVNLNTVHAHGPNPLDYTILPVILWDPYKTYKNNIGFKGLRCPSCKDYVKEKTTREGFDPNLSLVKVVLGEEGRKLLVYKTMTCHCNRQFVNIKKETMEYLPMQFECDLDLCFYSPKTTLTMTLAKGIYESWLANGSKQTADYLNSKYAHIFERNAGKFFGDDFDIQRNIIGEPNTLKSSFQSSTLSEKKKKEFLIGKGWKEIDEMLKKKYEQVKFAMNSSVIRNKNKDTSRQTSKLTMGKEKLTGSTLEDSNKVASWALICDDYLEDLEIMWENYSRLKNDDIKKQPLLRQIELLKGYLNKKTYSNKRRLIDAFKKTVLKSRNNLVGMCDLISDWKEFLHVKKKYELLRSQNDEIVSKYKEDLVIISKECQQPRKIDYHPFQNYADGDLFKVKFIREFSTTMFKKRRKYLIQQIVTRPGKVFRIDSTFKLAAKIRATEIDNDKNKTTFLPFESITLVVNEIGEIIWYSFDLEGENWENSKPIFKSLLEVQKQIQGDNFELLAVYIDNCCLKRNIVQKIFGENVPVKLDIFHFMQRFEKWLAVSKTSPFYEDYSSKLNKALSEAIFTKEEDGKRSVYPKEQLKANIDAFFDVIEEMNGKFETISRTTSCPSLLKKKVKEGSRDVDWITFKNNCKKHVAENCLTDPEGVPMYVEKADGTYKCVRGTSIVEQKNAMFKQLVQEGTTIGPLRAEAIVLEKICELNRKARQDYFKDPYNRNNIHLDPCFWWKINSRIADLKFNNDEFKKTFFCASDYAVPVKIDHLQFGMNVASSREHNAQENSKKYFQQGISKTQSSPRTGLNALPQSAIETMNIDFKKIKNGENLDPENQEFEKLVKDYIATHYKGLPTECTVDNNMVNLLKDKFNLLAITNNNIRNKSFAQIRSRIKQYLKDHHPAMVILKSGFAKFSEQVNEVSAKNKTYPLVDYDINSLLAPVVNQQLDNSDLQTHNTLLCFSKNSSLQPKAVVDGDYFNAPFTYLATEENKTVQVGQRRLEKTWSNLNWRKICKDCYFPKSNKHVCDTMFENETRKRDAYISELPDYYFHDFGPNKRRRTADGRKMESLLQKYRAIGDEQQTSNNDLQMGKVEKFTLFSDENVNAGLIVPLPAGCEQLFFTENNRMDTEWVSNCVLQSEGWINDNFVEGIFDILEAKNSQNTKFMFMYLQMGSLDGNRIPAELLRHFGNGLTRATKKSPKSLEILETIIIPYSINNNHWVLFSLNRCTLKVSILDSLKTGNESQRNFANLLVKGFQNHANCEVWKSEDWEICFVDDLPMQKNASDCGIFMLQFAIAILTVGDVPGSTVFKSKMEEFKRWNNGQNNLLLLRYALAHDLKNLFR